MYGCYYATGCVGFEPRASILSYKVLIIDEIGYLPMSREQANLFFQVAFRARRGRSLLPPVRPDLRIQQARAPVTSWCALACRSARQTTTPWPFSNRA